MKRLFLLFLGFSLCLTALRAQEDFIPPEYGSVIDVEPPASGMAIDGRTLFATFCGKAKCVAAFDLAVPEKPRLIAVFSIGFYPQGLALDRKEQKLYVADGRYVSILRFNGKKFILLERHLISADPLSGPADVALDPLDGELYIACRAGGLRKGFDLKNPPIATGFVRTVSPGSLNCYMTFDSGEYRTSVLFSEGRTVCELLKEILPDGRSGKTRQLRHGRQPGTIRKINGELVSLGFHGVGMIYQDYGSFENGGPNPSGTGKPLKQFSSYGTHVYDFCGGDGSENIYLAAGEIGVLRAHIQMSQRWGLLCFPESDCRELRWGNVNGIVCHPEKKIVYASDEMRGLHAIDVSAQRMKLLHTESLESAAKGQ